MLTGRCECSAVKYEVNGEVNDFSHCHCSQCRRLHGAAFASFAGVERKDFNYISGESAVRSYASSDSHARVFCGNCGSNIMVELDSEPDALYMAMGTVDGDPALPEAYHIFVGSKAPWHTISDHVAQHHTVPEDE